MSAQRDPILRRTPYFDDAVVGEDVGEVVVVVVVDVAVVDVVIEVFDKTFVSSLNKNFDK